MIITKSAMEAFLPLQDINSVFFTDQHMEDVYHNYLKACSNKGEDFAEPIQQAVQDAKDRLKGSEVTVPVREAFEGVKKTLTGS